MSCYFREQAANLFAIMGVGPGESKEENMPKVKVGDITMYYEVHGEGEPVVMINGAGASIEWSYWLIPTYSREYRLVLFDEQRCGPD